MNIPKRVLITGAGRGLGKACVLSFLQAGWKVVATDVNPELLKDLPSNENLLSFEVDVSSEKDVQECARQVQEKWGGLDVVVSNAGIFDFYPLSEAGADKLKKMLEVNMLGLANLSKYLLGMLVESRGRIVVISSESYKVPSPFQPYAVSKQSLESLYKAIKIELVVKGVKSILIRPGAMQTKIIDDTVTFDKNIRNSKFEEEFSGFIETVPKYIGKIVSPEKVAGVIFKAANVNQPKSVYKINHNPMVTLLSGLPGWLQDFIVRKSLSG